GVFLLVHGPARQRLRQRVHRGGARPGGTPPLPDRRRRELDRRQRRRGGRSERPCPRSLSTPPTAGGRRGWDQRPRTCRLAPTSTASGLVWTSARAPTIPPCARSSGTRM